MKIWFSDAKLGKVCNSQKKLNGKYGSRNAARITIRLTDLEAIVSLRDAASLPGRFHSLSGNFSGCFAMHLVHPDRLVFKPRKAWKVLSDVTEIEIVGIGDYH